MGNRAYLSKYTEEMSCTIFESNNNLPLFWIFLLNEETIKGKRSSLINCFYDEDDDYDNCCINIKTEILEKNIGVAIKYLNTHSTELERRFRDFSSFIMKVKEDSPIELDIIQLANFTTPEEFLDELTEATRKIGSGEIIDEVKHYNENGAIMYELVGYDDFSDSEYAFEDFSKEYKKLQKENRERIKEAKKDLELATREDEKREKIKHILFNIVFTGLAGLLFVLGGIAIIFYERRYILGICSILMGILAMIFAYANIEPKQ